MPIQTQENDVNEKLNNIINLLKKLMDLEDSSEEELKENSCQGVQVNALQNPKDQKTYQNKNDKKTNKKQIVKDYWPK